MKHCIIAYFACAFTFCSSMICNAQPSVSVSVRDLENLAIIDDVRQSTLEKMLNHCYTQTGKDYFQQSLCTLTCDISELKQRQKHLRTLVDHPEATFKINDLLAACGRQESILDVLGGDTRLAVLDEFYFKRASCLHLNNNPAALNASFFLHYVHLFTPLVEDALLHVGINSVFGHNHHHHHEHHHHNGVCDHSHNDGAFKQTMYYAVQGAHWALHMPGYYEMVIHIQTRAKKIAAARADIVRVKKYFQSIRSIYTKLVMYNPEFINNQTPILARTFSVNADDSVSVMVTKILDSSVHNTSLKGKLNPGAILAFYTDLKNNDAALKKIVHEVGIIDAYVNVARAVIADRLRYCFVSFRESTQPFVSIDGLWHHAISAQTMRPVSVFLDTQNACLVMRGANGSGKSTLLTAVGQALFLAQSWGIAPAQWAEITPFSCFYTHSLKRDSIEQGLSHFYYEHAYYENMLTQHNPGKSIVLLDEPYTCTDSQTGTGHVMNLINRLMQLPDQLAIITTHYSF